MEIQGNSLRIKKYYKTRKKSEKPQDQKNKEEIG